MSTRTTHRPPPHYDRRLTLPLVLGSVLNPVNSSMVAVALVPIGAAFGEPPARTAWLVSALYLTTAVGQPVVGRLVDRFGPRRLYLGATALVGVAGVIGLLAPSLDWLILSRVLLGLGTCSAFPAAMYLIRSEVERTGEDAPTGVLTLLSAANQTVAVVGPTVGGLLIGLGGWRLIFTVNVPLSVACLVLGFLRLPRRTAVAEQEPGAPGGVDVVGMVLFGVTLVSLMLFLMEPSTAHLWLLGVTVVAAGLLTWRELRTASAFLDVRLLGGNLPLLATYVRMLLFGTITYSFLYGFVQWLEDGRAMSPTAAGLLLLPMSGMAVLATLVVGRRPELFAKLLVGAAFAVVGAIGMTLVGTSTPVVLLALVTLAVGVGQGTMSLANQNAVYGQAPADRMGSAAGLLRTAMYLGAILSSAAVAGFFGDRADTGGLHELGLFVLGCAVVLLLLTVLDPSLRRITVGKDTTHADHHA